MPGKCGTARDPSRTGSRAREAIGPLRPHLQLKLAEDRPRNASIGSSTPRAYGRNATSGEGVQTTLSKRRARSLANSMEKNTPNLLRRSRRYAPRKSWRRFPSDLSTGAQAPCGFRRGARTSVPSIDHHPICRWWSIHRRTGAGSAYCRCIGRRAAERRRPACTASGLPFASKTFRPLPPG